MDETFVLQLSKLLFKLNQLVQGYPVRILGEQVVQRTNLLKNLTTRSCGNKVILPERHPEYHEPPICHLVLEGSLLSKQTIWSCEFWHKPNSLTEDVRLNNGQGNTVKLRLVMESTDHAKNDSNVLRVQAIKIAKNLGWPH